MQVVFNLVDGAGNVIDTDTSTVHYVAPGATVLVAPLQIGFEAPVEPAGVNVTALGTFSRDSGPSGGKGFTMSKGISMTVVSADIQRDQYFSKVAGQVTNPTSEVVNYPTVTCIFRADGALIGGLETSITDPIAPGATIAFHAGSGDIPANADSTECSVVD